MRALGVLLLAILLPACGSSPSSGSHPDSATCVSGAVASCSCVGLGLVGAQTCIAGSYGPCVCPDSDAGTDAGTATDAMQSTADIDTGTMTDTVVAVDVISLPAPRSIAPMSTSTVTSQTPSLHWILASGTDGARVQICHDRACSSIEQTLDVTGTSAVPTSTLTPGTHYWRLFGRSGTTVSATSGPVWQFHVGHLSAPRDTYWGTTPDFNGDGYADVLVGAFYSDNAYVAAGGPSGPGTATLITPPVLAMGFGNSVSAAGDFNGDGYGDAVIGADNSSTVYVYLGGPTGLGSTPLTLPTPPGSAGFGQIVTGVGDVNGDGYGDVLILAASTGGTSVYVVYGAASATLAMPSLVASSSMFLVFGGAGDLNDDGYADITENISGYNTLNVYFGSATGLGTSPTVLHSPSTFTAFGAPQSGPGDINGDGYADLVCGGFYMLGGAAGPSTTATLSGALSGSVVVPGDLNGDGYDDFVEYLTTSFSMGHATVYLGAASSPGSSTMNVIGPATGSGYGWALWGTGDINGDGAGDLAGYSQVSGLGIYLSVGALVDGAPTILMPPTGASVIPTSLALLQGTARRPKPPWLARVTAPGRATQNGAAFTRRAPGQCSLPYAHAPFSHVPEQHSASQVPPASAQAHVPPVHVPERQSMPV